MKTKTELSKRDFQVIESCFCDYMQWGTCEDYIYAKQLINEFYNYELMLMLEEAYQNFHCETNQNINDRFDKLQALIEES